MPGFLGLPRVATLYEAARFNRRSHEAQDYVELVVLSLLHPFHLAALQPFFGCCTHRLWFQICSTACGPCPNERLWIIPRGYPIDERVPHHFNDCHDSPADHPAPRSSSAATTSGVWFSRTIQAGGKPRWTKWGEMIVGFCLTQNSCLNNTSSIVSRIGAPFLQEYWHALSLSHSILLIIIQNVLYFYPFSFNFWRFSVQLFATPFKECPHHHAKRDNLPQPILFPRLHWGIGGLCLGSNPLLPRVSRGLCLAFVEGIWVTCSRDQVVMSDTWTLDSMYLLSTFCRWPPQRVAWNLKIRIAKALAASRTSCAGPGPRRPRRWAARTLWCRRSFDVRSAAPGGWRLGVRFERPKVDRLERPQRAWCVLAQVEGRNSMDGNWIYVPKVWKKVQLIFWSISGQNPVLSPSCRRPILTRRTGQCNGCRGWKLATGMRKEPPLNRKWRGLSLRLRIHLVGLWRFNIWSISYCSHI